MFKCVLYNSSDNKKLGWLAVAGDVVLFSLIVNVSVVEVVVAISEVAIGTGLPDRACDALDTLVVAPTIVSFI